MEFDNTVVRPLKGQTVEKFAAVMDSRYIANDGTTPEQKAVLAGRGYEVL